MFHVFSKARKHLARGAAAVAFLAVAACQPITTATGGNTGPAIDTSAPVPVALLVPGAGGSPQDASVSRSIENAVRLAISELNGVQVDLTVYPTNANPAQAAQSAARAVNDGAKIIVGPLYAEAANAVGTAVAGAGVNVLSLSNNTEIAGGNVFVLGATFANTAERLAGYARRQGKSRVHIVHSADLSGQVGRDAIARAVAGQGGTVTGQTAYALNQVSVVDAVQNIRSAVATTSPDSIFFTSNSAGALPLFAELLPESGISSASHQFMGLARWDIPPATLDLSGLQGGWFAIPDPAKNAQFTARYQAAYGAAPHPTVAAPAYDAIAAIGALVRGGRSNALTTTALTQGAGFQGVHGIFRLRRDGTNERGLAVATIRNRQVVVIDPAPRSFGGAGF